MRLLSRIGFVGVALVAVVAALGGCGAGGSASRASEGKRMPKAPPPQAPQPIVVAHRVGPKRVERGKPTEALSASPCENKGENGTTTVPIGPDIGYCAQVAPWGRLDVVNVTGVPIQVRIDDYKMRLRPRQTGMIPASVRSFLGHGGHGVRATAEQDGTRALDSTIWVLTPGCVLRPEDLEPGEKLCFPSWVRHREQAAKRWRREHPHRRPDARIVAE